MIRAGSTKLYIVDSFIAWLKEQMVNEMIVSDCINNPAYITFSYNPDNNTWSILCPTDHDNIVTLIKHIPVSIIIEMASAYIEYERQKEDILRILKQVMSGEETD